MSVPEKAATLRAFIVKRFTLVPPDPKKRKKRNDASWLEFYLWDSEVDEIVKQIMSAYAADAVVRGTWSTM